MYSYKELSELAGDTYLVFLRVLDDLHDDLYIKMGEHETQYTLEKIDGTITYGYNGVEFNDITVITPSGDGILILRQQIIYPHTVADMATAGRTDTNLYAVLDTVHLTYIPDGEGGLDSIKEWKDVFSGGEKQRMQFARLFYHTRDSLFPMKRQVPSVATFKRFSTTRLKTRR
ncbi:hypothetical protein HK100_005866 [Physocladia obscura]|uniref:Uncharacterized protein n=1 Tax=Physocladia obscura TaxID=109957 RepID=A0AAD5SR03_9FUNG|nr:hypothetical protein HK100_005866 [Physocladia obscura]